MATEKSARRVLIGLILVSIALVLVVASPFFEAFFLAAVLAGALQGLHRWLTQRFRGRSGLSAGVITVGTILTPATHDPKARKSAPGKDGRPVGPVPSPGRGLQLASARKSVPTRHVPRAVPPRRSHPVEVGRKSAGRRRR